MVFLIWLGVTLASLTALFWARRFYSQMLVADEGTEEMQSIAQSVRDGAGAYLNQQNKWVAIVFIVVAAILATAAATTQLVNPWLPIAFLMGGSMSGLCGWFGMKTATAASGRTAAAARTSLTARSSASSLPRSTSKSVITPRSRFTRSRSESGSSIIGLKIPRDTARFLAT